MGMFDYVDFECICPLCKSKVTGFQSKDGACMLDNLKIWDVRNFYSHCSGCWLWIEFKRYGNDNKKITIKEFIIYTTKHFDNLRDANDFYNNPVKSFKKSEKKRLGELYTLFNKKRKTTSRRTRKWIK